VSSPAAAAGRSARQSGHTTIADGDVSSVSISAVNIRASDSAVFA